MGHGMAGILACQLHNLNMLERRERVTGYTLWRTFSQKIHVSIASKILLDLLLTTGLIMAGHNLLNRNHQQHSVKLNHHWLKSLLNSKATLRMKHVKILLIFALKTTIQYLMSALN